MKKTLLIFACAGLVAAAALSCKKNNLDQPGFPGLRFAAGGKEYVMDTAFYQRSLGTSIHGTLGSSEPITIYLSNTDTIGSVSLDTAYNTAYFRDGVTTWQSISGTASISQYYNDSLRVISGTFNFKARDRNDFSKTMDIQYGYFNNIPRH